LPLRLVASAARGAARRAGEATDSIRRGRQRPGIYRSPWRRDPLAWATGVGAAAGVALAVAGASGAVAVAIAGSGGVAASVRGLLGARRH
jgi:hypothetical protein